MCWTPFKTLWWKIGNWCKIDSFQYPTFICGTQPLCLDSFRDSCDSSSFDSFQDPMFVYSTKLFKLTPFKTPALDYIVSSFSIGDTLQIYSVKSPWEPTFNKIGSFRTISHSESWTHFKTPASHYTVFSFSMGDFPQEINSFRSILHSEFWIPFKTPVTHTSHSVNGLISRPFRRGKEDRAHGSTVLVTFWTPFKTPHWKSKKTQGNWTDHSSSSSSHLRRNVIVPNKLLSDF